jgi:hypothetical protein
MSATHYVKHPKFSADELEGKSLAWCEKGSIVQCRLHTAERQSDGRHTLSAGWAAVYPVTSKSCGTTAFREPLLDQNTVDRIVAVDSRADPLMKGFDFAIVQDQSSAIGAAARV